MKTLSVFSVYCQCIDCLFLYICLIDTVCIIREYTDQGNVRVYDDIYGIRFTMKVIHCE